MKSRAWDFRILTLIGLCFLSSIGNAHGPPTTIHARTSAEIINAILAANSSDLPTVILVAPNHYQFVESFSSEFGPSALPGIKSNVTIVGRDPATTILDAGGIRGNTARVLTVLPGGRLTLRKMTVTGGRDAGELQDRSRNGGGAAANFSGFLRFQDCVLSGNAADAEFGALGGAILSVNGRVEIVRTTVSDNGVDQGSGGGLALIGGSGVIRDSIIRGNGAVVEGPTAAGGGIYVGLKNSKLGIYGSTIAGNFAGKSIPNGDVDSQIANGGGIYNVGTVTLVNSAVVGNSAGFSNDLGRGGGIFNDGGVMTIKNVTVGGNTVSTAGGGIYNIFLGILRLQGVTIASNNTLSDEDPIAGPTSGGGVWNEPSATISTAGSVFAGNTLGNRVTPGLGPDCAGTLRSQGHNAVGNGADCTLKPAMQGTSTNDLINVDTRLAALEDNGAPGNAHYRLRAGSPLIDAGDVVGPRCTFEDQIGQRRVDGDQEGNVACDIGAIEFTPTSP